MRKRTGGTVATLPQNDGRYPLYFLKVTEWGEEEEMEGIGGGRKYDGRNGIRCSNKGDPSQRRFPVILSKAKNPVKEISKIRKFLGLAPSVATFSQNDGRQ